MAEIDQETLSAIQTRMQGIRDWIADEAPYAAADQRHLHEHTIERAYWHYGYQAALGDVLALIERRANEEDRSERPDNSS